MRKKTLIKLVYAAAAFFMFASNRIYAIYPRDFGKTADGFYYEITKDGTETIITGYSGDKTGINIPETIEGKTVTSIGSQAFVWRSEITSVNIPSTVDSIGLSAFAKCLSLEKINIPDEVDIISENTFHDCEKLTEIILPEYLSEIKRNAFENCISLAHIEFPDSLKIIGNSAFENCISLTHIELPDDLKTIGNSAFENCKSLKAISIPAVFSVGDHSFKGCHSLEKVEIAEGVELIDEYAFAECLNLTEIIIPASVEKIAENAFIACPGTMVIKGYPDSFAEGFAKAKGIRFEISEPAAEYIEKTSMGQRQMIVMIISLWLPALAVASALIVIVAKRQKKEKNG